MKHSNPECFNSNGKKNTTAQSRVSHKRIYVTKSRRKSNFTILHEGRNLRCQRHEALGLQIYGPDLQTRRTWCTIPRPFLSARVKLIKQSRTNYLLDISRDVNPAAQFSVEAYCVSPLPVLSRRALNLPLPPRPLFVVLRSFSWDYSNVVLSRVILENIFQIVY